MIRQITARALVVFMLMAQGIAAGRNLAEDGFESGLGLWVLQPPERAVIVAEPGANNSVLRLTPQRGEYTQILLRDSEEFRNVRLEGRFLFPTDGDGYLGFIYNHQQGSTRTDSGVIYVKSNGSYLRISPHHDGNPSWRLYEEYKVNLEGDRRIQTGVWYSFRLDVRGHSASLAIGDLESPLVRFEAAPKDFGSLGLEARPGGGEAVWVDDIVVSSLHGSKAGSALSKTPSAWETLGAFEPLEDFAREAPDLPQAGWQPISTDFRGALITGVWTQYRSGEQSWLYLRQRFVVEEGEMAPTWLAASTANRLDVWLNGYFRGTVAKEQYIWSDFASSKAHPGARIPLSPKVGENELLIRVYGKRFAGGGMFLELMQP
jgi:hypothetical protein